MCNLHMRFFLLEVKISLCVHIVHSYMEFQKLIHNPKFLILFRPPQVVTCSSASEN